jgi:hypothetical protein
MGLFRLFRLIAVSIEQNDHLNKKTTEHTETTEFETLLHRTYCLLEKTIGDRQPPIFAILLNRIRAELQLEHL